ncbi:hypothetical protein [Cesiribacter andamanensis]|uniref:Carboxypeptidase regulatory-like domain-containing protein n=1 Tax=Cesiribacter andamanensis AMV16 TaxID=1279009 RepID=M7NA92_9BACT|nr:hypothetical protein [Cesiribacter andamanensis]EMR04121.1 hypothetical protein ADICEAN_00744 [Cesiribacter andamanensis AMV16]
MANSCDSDTVKQGLSGQVIWVEGNQMPGIIDDTAPSPSPSPERPQPRGIEREVHIYALTKTSQAQANGVFYSNLQTELVKTVRTNEEGNFTVALPQGSYSVFVQEEEGLFANLMDGEGNINPVTVSKDSLSTLTIEVNYKAAY